MGEFQLHSQLPKLNGKTKRREFHMGNSNGRVDKEDTWWYAVARKHLPQEFFQ